jgi:MFS family permease
MTSTEKRAIVALSSIMSMRMLGLFMIFPVFALYAQHLPGSTPIMVGLAIGIYGLTQASLQIPFGMLSDHFGRKPIIYIGLLLFCLGSIVAAMSTTMTGIILGRALQGCGAIASTILALTADLSREEHRTKAMAILGMSIGASFLVSLLAGPLFYHWIGMSGIFWFTAIAALSGIVILHKMVPDTVRLKSNSGPIPEQFKRVLHNSQLLRLNFGILVLHLSLTSLFVVFPLALIDSHLEAAQHWQIYAPVLFLSVVVMIPFVIIAEKYRRFKLIFVSAIGLLALSQFMMGFLHHSLITLAIILFFFFTAMNLLESTLPSLISKIAPIESKGTAMGVYSSSQFFGAFLGGILGGWLHQHYSIDAVFILGAGLSVAWFIFALSMKSPPYLSSHILSIGKINQEQAVTLSHSLAQIHGVAEVLVIIEDNVAYLKVDRKKLDAAALDQYSVQQ